MAKFQNRHGIKHNFKVIRVQIEFWKLKCNYLNLKTHPLKEMDVVVVYFVHYVKNIYSTRFSKNEEIEEKVKINKVCIGQDSNLAPPR